MHDQSQLYGGLVTLVVPALAALSVAVAGGLLLVTWRRLTSANRAISTVA